MKITSKTKVCEVLHQAAKTAKGTTHLYHLGARCLWGEVAHLCGVSDEQMEGQGAFRGEDTLEMDVDMLGMTEWDSGAKKYAVDLACQDSDAGETVADFREFLKGMGYRLRAVRA